MTPQTTLLEALEKAAEADVLVSSLPGIVHALERGQLSIPSPGRPFMGDPFSVQSADRPLLETLIFEHHVVTPDRLALFKPLLDAVAQRGHTPWGGSGFYPSTTIYGFLTSDLVCDELLEWCWQQPQAPAFPEASIARQVHSDRLSALLRDYPPGHVSHERMMQQRGFGLNEGWSTGKTTFERIVEHLTLRLPATQKGFEWTGTLRRCRQLSKAAAKECPANLHFLALVPASLAAERAWRAHEDARKFSSTDARPEWAGTWLETLKDLAPPQGGKRGTPLQGWEAFMAWSVQSAPPSVEVVGAVAAGWRVMAAMFPEEFAAKANRLHLVDTVTQGLERMGVEILLASRSSLEERYPLDHAFWQDFEEGLGKKEGQEKWTVDELWKAVLPLAIKSDPEKSLSAFFTKRMERHLPKDETFQWPNVPFWNQVVAHWGWEETLQAKARAQGLEQKLEETLETVTPSRARPRF